MRDDKNQKNRQATTQHQPDAWKFVKPKAGKPKHKQVDGKDFYWCPNANGMWCRHKPDKNHFNLLKQKHKIKDSTNIAQLAVDSKIKQHNKMMITKVKILFLMTALSMMSSWILSKPKFDNLSIKHFASKWIETQYPNKITLHGHKFEQPPYLQLFNDPSRMAGCLSHDRGNTTI